MIRTKGEAGSGNIVEAVRHIRTIVKEMKQLTVLGQEELVHEAKNLGAPLELVEWVAANGKLPVPNFSAGGIATPADAALVMQLGAEAVFVGSGIFKSEDPGQARARHRQGGDLLQRSGEAARSQRGAGRSHARPGYFQASRKRTAADARLVTRRRPPAFWPSRAISKRIAKRSSAPAAMPSKCAPLADLERCDGLIIPGGESTTMLKLLDQEGLTEPLKRFASTSRSTAVAPARFCWRAKSRIPRSRASA